MDNDEPIDLSSAFPTEIYFFQNDDELLNKNEWANELPLFPALDDLAQAISQDEQPNVVVFIESFPYPTDDSQKEFEVFSKYC